MKAGYVASLVGCGMISLAACHHDDKSAADSPGPTLLGREPCTDQTPDRRLLWGDLHVHTAYSFDAWTYDVRLTPADAYRFARGETVQLPPLDADGNGTLSVHLDRALDFAAVTDHSEFLGEVSACTTPGAVGYDSDTCDRYRQAGAAAVRLFGILLTNAESSRPADVCPEGEDARCASLTDDLWERIQAAAEDAYDRTATCDFTSFVGYEWTGATTSANLHRNVIFANEAVPAVPISYFDEADPWGLWGRLQTECLDAGTGCDVLAIPHNANLSNGTQFAVEYPADADPVEAAAFRARMEPLFEVYQHKGQSECLDVFSAAAGAPDELCSFETYGRDEAPDCGDGTGAGGMTGDGCASRLDTLRGVLAAGLQEEQRIGVNPYRLGVIASTDTHSGTPGAVEESTYRGHLGTAEDDPAEQLTEPGLNPGGYWDSPGGLVAVWAEENSREAIFAALRRRETYGTSGPRIALRFFGGWDIPAEACTDSDLTRPGTPMGSVLPAAPAGGTAPSFLVSAMADTRNPVPLQRVQIVKGSVDPAGEVHLVVYDVDGGEDGAAVDPTTCTTTGGSGAQSRCGVWTDPAFNPAEPAFYYARVLEEPTCRWSGRVCAALPVEERPAACTDPAVPATVQERAWSSPIWVATGE